jgi:hypothetical protein
MRHAGWLGLVFLAGCAIGTQRRAPYPVRLDVPPDCDTSRRPAVVDTVAAVATAALTGAVLVQSFTDDETTSVGKSFAVSFLVVPAAFTYSAYTGYAESGRCRRLRGAVRAVPPSTGYLGNACLPIEDGKDVCLDGSRCEAGVCQP